MECGLPHARTLAGVIAALHPRLWGVHALGLAAVAAAVVLGIWQWNVGDGRKATQSHEYAHLVPVPLASVISPGASFPASELGRPVRVTGTWVPGSTVLVASGSKPRYWVASAVQSGSSAVYVVIGAQDDPVHRPEPAATAALTGWLQPNVSSADPVGSDGVLPRMSNGLAASKVPATLLDGYVVADRPLEHLAAVPEPPLPKANFWTGLRNWLYAIEWWFFGCFAAFIWSRQIRDMTALPAQS